MNESQMSLSNVLFIIVVLGGAFSAMFIFYRIMKRKADSASNTYSAESILQDHWNEMLTDRKTAYLLKCKDCSFTHPVASTFSDQDVFFITDASDVKMSCTYKQGSRDFMLSLEVKDFFTITTIPPSGQTLHAEIARNLRILHDHMKSHYDPLYLIINQSENSTAHIYRKRAEGIPYIKYSKEQGVDVFGKINFSKAEVPGISEIEA